MNEFEITPAKPDHYSERVAALMWSADPPLNCFLFGGLDFWVPFLRREWSLKYGWLGHGATHVALSAGQVIGLVTCHTAEEFSRRTAAALARWPDEYEPDIAQRLAAGLSSLGALFPPVPSDAFYMLELAVDPANQGRGVGRALFELAEQQAQSLGYARLHLDVAADRPAVDFYRRAGMRVAIETRLPDLDSDHRVGLHYHMVKDLS